MSTEAAKTVVDVLGRERPVVHVFDDGSYDCPFCGYAVPVPQTACDAPHCTANPSVKWAREFVEKQETREREDRERKERHEWGLKEAKRRREEERQWREEQIAECEKRGACRACLFLSGVMRVKFVKHRGSCPKSRAA